MDHSKGLFHFLVFAKKSPHPRADIDNGIKSVIALLEEEKTFNFIMIGMLIFNCIFCCFLFKFSTMSLKQRKWTMLSLQLLLEMMLWRYIGSKIFSRFSCSNEVYYKKCKDCFVLKGWFKRCMTRENLLLHLENLTSFEHRWSWHSLMGHLLVLMRHSIVFPVFQKNFTSIWQAHVQFNQYLWHAWRS